MQNLMSGKVLLALVVVASPGCDAGATGAIWGKCDSWDRSKDGCDMTGEHKCSAFLSSGPKDAPFELVLADLPASTSEKAVHLQWFGAHEAPQYNPLAEKQLWRVFASPHSSYPKFTDEDFNGGNVRVNETGHAVMRFRAPSTYKICGNRIRYPHIHVRLCHGESFAHRVESVDFVKAGVKIRSCGGTKKYRVASFRQIAPIPQPPEEDTTYELEAGQSGQRPWPQEDTTTQAPIIIDATTLMSTTKASTTSKFLVADTLEENSQPEGDDSFDWDALEFSPVYQCLLDKKVYDLLGSGCVAQCPPNSEEKHGQCVRKSMGAEVELNVAWNLQVQCDEACWNAKTPRTRHLLRLAAADHLDITFQEVLKVVLRPVTADSRRLQEKGFMSSASLLISIKTNRVDASSGQYLLQEFLKDASDASQILGLDVKSLKLEASEPTSEKLEAGEEEDEFAAMYDEVERDNAGSFGSSPTDGLPPAVIVGGGAAVLVLGGLVSACMWYKRRQAFTAAAANSQMTITAKKVEGDDDLKQAEGVVVGKEDEKL
jgi:hypothetical protein